MQTNRRARYDQSPEQFAYPSKKVSPYIILIIYYYQSLEHIS